MTAGSSWPWAIGHLRVRFAAVRSALDGDCAADKTLHMDTSPVVDAAPLPTPPARGLTAAEAARRLRRDGPNAVEAHLRRTYLAILVAQLASPLVVILLAASALSVAVGEHVGLGIILVIVALSAALGFVQEARSESAVAALRARLAPRATVVRDGRQEEIPATHLVSGDLVALRAGDVVPADGRLVEANHLFVDEAALTGESEATAKAVGTASDQSGAVFFGTSVVSGEGQVVLTATGTRTAYGAIARRLEERAPETDFQRGVRRFGLLIARLTLLLVVGVFAVDVGLHRPLFESLLFAIALAVGLTPELLPAIVTVNLSRGARALASQGVLVKHLAAIQNLGSLTVLCTDKTGTLTEGRLRLVGALRVDCADAPAAAAAAWLNSHFESGFPNPLDQAILASLPAPAEAGSYRKLAELPFDFHRRCLSVLVAGPDGAATLISKGAPEAILARSVAARTADGPVPLGANERAAIARRIDDAAAQGQRAVAVATRAGLDGALLEVEDERGLLFEGLLLFADPPKVGISETLADLERMGLDLRIVAGDHELVARALATTIGLPVTGVLTGDEIGGLGHAAFVARAQTATIFARVDPDQKLRVIRALQERGAVVGYLGDGINDAPPLHVADVGISVDGATDVARAAADLILLEPSLAAIAAGVHEGRRTFANTLKYIRMGTSSNFGNMLSMAGATLVLPFLPMLPGQILLNNLIYDASQSAIPSDGVDPEESARRSRWDIGGLERFMLVFGPLSSLFDYLTFALLFALLGVDETAFHTGWFVESLATQVLVIFAIRTERSPFWRSRPSRPLVLSAAAAVAVAVGLPLSPLGPALGFGPLPLTFWLCLPLVVAAYLALVEVVKRWFWRRSRRPDREP